MNNMYEIEKILDRQAVRAADVAARMEQGRKEGMARVRASQEALRASMERGNGVMANMESAMDIIRSANFISRALKSE